MIRLALLLALLAVAPVPAQAAACAMDAADRAWIEGALAAWRRVERVHLKLPAQPIPTVVTFDARCAFTRESGQGDRAPWGGMEHKGAVALPDGQTLPPGVVSFAAPSEGGGFFVMSLPSVWRAAGVTSGLGLERLMDGVLIHEMAHTRQFYFVNPRLEALSKRYGLPDDINDDSLQAAFKDDPAYVADYEAERDILFAAAAAPTRAEAKRLAAAALVRMRARRARWFVGEAEKWTPLEEVFLTMEGVGQWAIHAWLTDPRGGGLTPEAALPEVRRGSRWWSQDSGLALFLVIDRLVPDWERQAFAARPATVEALLAQAAR